MAAGRLPAPGTEYGPCADACAHRDCASTRKQAESACRFCDRPIGYEVRFYVDPEHEEQPGRRYVHARCLEEIIEQKRRSQ